MIQILFLLVTVFCRLAFADDAVEKSVQEYLKTMTPEQIARSDSYFEGGYWLQLWGLLYGLGVAAIMLRFRWTVKMRDLAKRITRFSFLRSWIFFIQYALCTFVLAFPLSVYQEYFREHKYGLSNLTFAAWMGEQAKAIGVSLLLMGFFISVLYWLISKLRSNWWVWGTVASGVFMAFALMIAPVFISPLFNKYVALPQGEIREQVLSMARSNGVPAEEVYTFDASKQSKRISANVSGLLGTTRVSLNDNLLNRTSTPEIRAVMAHEIGHYALGHGPEFLVEFSLLILCGFYFTYRVMNWFLKRYSSSLNLGDQSDIATLPILGAAFSIFMFLATPVANSIIRTNESEADIFGLNLAREPDGFAKVAVKLSEYRKMSPGPWEEVIFYDHPSGENRIRMAMKWKQENKDILPVQSSSRRGAQ